MIIKTIRDKDPFTRIKNETIQDSRLSWKARGLLTYLLSLPEDWEVVVEDLVNRGPDKHSAIYSALKELRECGYARVVVRRDERGRITAKEWQVRGSVSLNRDFLNEVNLNEENRRLQTKQRKQTKHASPLRGTGACTGFDLEMGHSQRNPVAAKFVKKFAQFAQSKKWTIGAKGCTRLGTLKPRTAQQWERAISNLLESVPPKEVKEVLLWWMEHHADNEYMIQAMTLPSFCEKFIRIRQQKERTQKFRNGEHTEDEVEKELVILLNGEGKLVPIR